MMPSSVLRRHYLSGSKIEKQLNNNKCLVLQLGLLSPAGAPRTERRPGGQLKYDGIQVL